MKKIFNQNIPYKFLMNKIAQLNGNIDIAIDSNKQLLNYTEKNRCDTGKHKVLQNYSLLEV
jgi:hypothetical protein